MPHSNATFEEEDLSALLDGELSAAEAATLQARVDADPALQAELSALSEARAFMADHGTVPAPTNLLSDILAAAAAIDAEEGTVVQLSWWKRPLGVPVAGWAVAAAALLVVYVALPSFDGGEAESGRTNAAARAPMKAGDLVQKEVLPREEAVEKTAYRQDNQQNDAVAMVEPTPAVNVEGTYGSGSLELPKTQSLTSKNKSNADKNVATKPLAKSSPKKMPGLVAPKGTADAGEEQADGDQVGFAQVPYQYTLYTDDTQALMQLSAIAGRYRGELTGPNDSVLELEELQGSQSATVVVKIPAHALQDFGRAIKGLGSVHSSADNRMFAGDPVEVRVKVQLAAGRNDDNQAPANAARKLRAMDEMNADSVEQAL